MRFEHNLKLNHFKLISNFKFQISNSEKGVSLIITFFVMVIILGINLSISAILYSEIKIIRNTGNSVSAFYAAESGVEKVLYYNRRVLPPAVEDGETDARGLCFMCSSDNPDACLQDPGGNGGDKSVYCNNCRTYPNSPDLEGCDPYICDNCEVTFQTHLDLDRRYEATASVSSEGGSNDLFFKIDSTGYYKEYVLRAIEINMSE